MDELTKAYIYLAVTLIFISFAVTPLYGSVSAASRNDVKLLTKNIAGAVNMAMASPSDNLVYVLDLPKNCVVEINGLFVLAKYGDAAAAEEFIQKKGFSVSQLKFNCNDKRQLIITKSKNTITVTVS